MYTKHHPITRAERRACREEARLRLGHIATLKPRQQPKPINHLQERRNARREIQDETGRIFGGV